MMLAGDPSEPSSPPLDAAGDRRWGPGEEAGNNRVAGSAQDGPDGSSVTKGYRNIFNTQNTWDSFVCG